MIFDQKLVRNYVKEIGLNDYRTDKLFHKFEYPEVLSYTEVEKSGARKDYRYLHLKNQSTTYLELIENELNLRSDKEVGSLLKEAIQIIICAEASVERLTK